MLKIRFVKELDAWLASVDNGKSWKLLEKGSALTAAYFQDFEDASDNSQLSY